MSDYLQQILVPVKGAPDIILSIDPNNTDDIYVFLGMALLEKVPRSHEHIAFKMLLARLYNGGVTGQRLTNAFGVARSTLRRWGEGLKSGNADRILATFSGQGAPRKVTPEIEAYVRDRFLDLQKEQCHNYSKVIQAEVKKYFSVSVSAERLRWIFRDVKDEQGISSSQSETNHGEIDVGTPAGELVVDGANSCEMTNKTADASSPNPTPRNYSLQTMPCSGRILPAAPTLCHHAGVALMSHWIDMLSDGWSVQPDLVRQLTAQVLLGAVNHEQSKQLSFSSLEWLIGPSIRSLNYQRSLLGGLADMEHIHSMLERNGRLLDLAANDLFYFDPHTEQYTGMLKTLRGWCGAQHKVEKIINMDFIHTENGDPCFVQHADNFYDMRERFFMSIKTFRDLFSAHERTLTWVTDRGLYGLETFQRMIDDKKDHFITWDKNYKRDGWDETKTSHQFEVLKPRNRSEDLHCYRFEWQEHPWPRDTRVQRLIVRAVNPHGRSIEVAVLISDPARDRRTAISAMFNRWLQENDFGYMDRHVGINELTSRVHQDYATIENDLDDRQVQSQEYKTLKREKTKIELILKKLLLKQRKQRKKHANKSRSECRSQKRLAAEISSLSENSNDVRKQKDLEKHQRALERMVEKHKSNSKKRAESKKVLDKKIAEHINAMEAADRLLAESVREESRLQALIDEQFVRLDTRRKAFMDSIRITLSKYIL